MNWKIAFLTSNQKFRALAMELVESKVDVIVAVAGIGGKEAKQATSTIPIVIATDPDPVGNGLVQSLAHPGGDVTGLSLMMIDLSDKRLGLFKELVPDLSRLAILVDPRDGFSTRIRAGYEKAAKAIRASNAERRSDEQEWYRPRIFLHCPRWI